MSHPRTRLALEALEARENPVVETFNLVTPPALPDGWSTWTSDFTTSFTTASGRGVDGTIGLVSEAGRRTSAPAGARPRDTQAADTGAGVSVRVDSLVPMFVFTRGNNLDEGPRSYLAAVVTRGLKLQLLEVSGGFTRVLGTVNSPSSAYFSGG